MALSSSLSLLSPLSATVHTTATEQRRSTLPTAWVGACGSIDDLNPPLSRRWPSLLHSAAWRPLGEERPTGWLRGKDVAPTDGGARRRCTPRHSAPTMAATTLLPHLQPSACLWPRSMSRASLECQAAAQARSTARRPDPAGTGRIWDAR